MVSFTRHMNRASNRKETAEASSRCTCISMRDIRPTVVLESLESVPGRTDHEGIEALRILRLSSEFEKSGLIEGKRSGSAGTMHRVVRDNHDQIERMDMVRTSNGHQNPQGDRSARKRLPTTTLETSMSVLHLFHSSTVNGSHLNSTLSSSLGGGGFGRGCDR